MPRARPSFTELPLFASDREIGAALLGQERAHEFTGIAALLEPRGFPRINLVWGGRYTPAVRAFLDNEHGLTAVSPGSPNGLERPETWTASKKRRA